MKSLVLLLMLLSSFPAFSKGFALDARLGKEGGGGQGYLCKNPDGSRTLESVDLYEAKYAWGATIPESGSLRNEMERIFTNIALYYQTMAPNLISVDPHSSPAPKGAIDGALGAYADFLVNLNPIRAGQRLALSNDNGGLIFETPENCELVQVLYYADQGMASGRVLVDNEYWNLLSPQDQLAYWLHETTYKELRSSGEQSSEDTRKIVGMLLDNKRFPGAATELEGHTEALFCSAGDSAKDASFSFYAIKGEPYPEFGEEPSLKLVFNSISLDTNAPMRMFVSTTANSIWTFDEFSTGYINTSGQVLHTSSVLGSYTITLDVTDRSCFGDSNKKCITTLKVLADDNEWYGGEISCRKPESLEEKKEEPTP